MAASNNKFWTNAPTSDPKRGYRFRVQFGDLGYLWWAKTATKPEISIKEASHKYLNHTYYWPGSTEWNTVEIKLVDPVDPDVAGDLVERIKSGQYLIPSGIEERDYINPSKGAMAAALGPGNVIIEQINSTGMTLERWTLNNAWITKVSFGELSYEQEDLTEITVSLRYDWASFDSPDNIGRGTSVDGAFSKSGAD